MHVDHFTFAAGPEGLESAVARLEDELGEHFRDGGFHPSFGTRNHILPLADARYIEVVEVLDHPAAERAPYGQAVRARSQMGGGWLAWVISVDDISAYEERLHCKAAEGTRQFPDGRRLEWRQIGVRGLMADPQLPYFVQWDSDEETLPRALKGDIQVTQVEIAGHRQRVEDWIGETIDDTFDGVRILFSSEHGHPGLDAVTFVTPHGEVRI